MINEATTDAAPSAAAAPVRLLIVDDDANDAALTRQLLNEAGAGAYQLDWVAEPAAGLAALVERTHHVYLLDYRLGGGTDGIAILSEAVGVGCTAPVIVLTGQGDEGVSLAAMRAGAADYLDKADLTAWRLDRTIRHALSRKRRVAELQRLFTSLEVARGTGVTTTSPGGTETILLVEDEPALRALTARALRRFGYLVIEASHSRDALALLERHAGTVHLVLTDVAMPELEGPELLWLIRRSQGEVRSLYMSGYPGRARTGSRALAGDAPLLAKPFTVNELLQAVRLVLDAPVIP